MELAKEHTIKTSELAHGDVMGKTSDGGTYYYFFGSDGVTGDKVFINLRTGRVLRTNPERR